MNEWGLKMWRNLQDINSKMFSEHSGAPICYASYMAHAALYN